MPSVLQQHGFPHAVWLEEAFHKQTQGHQKLPERRKHANGYKRTDPKTQPKTTQAQDLFCKNMKRQSTSADKSKSPFVSVRQHKLLQ